MDESPFENAICFLCDFGHWILLGLIALGVAAWFTRGYWLPAAAPPIATPVTVTPTAGGSPTAEARPTSARPTPTATPELYGYTNVEGGYALNYPIDWMGTETGTDAHFFVPGDAKAQISVRESLPDETLSSLTDDSGPLPSPPSLVAEVAVGGEPALKQDFLTEQGTISGRAYHVIHSGRVYFIALFSSPEAPVPSSFADTLTQFDQLVAGFQFISP